MWSEMLCAVAISYYGIIIYLFGTSGRTGRTFPSWISMCVSRSLFCNSMACNVKSIYILDYF